MVTDGERRRKHGAAPPRYRHAMRPHLGLVSSIVALTLTACGTTNGDAIEHLRPDYAAERARLAGYVATLPPSETITATSFAAFSPPLVWGDVARGEAAGTNAAFVSLGQLANPDVRPIDRGPDVTMTSELIECLQWTGPENPMSASALGNRDGEGLEARCRAALAVPYLVVLRPGAFQSPTAISPETYAPGVLSMEVIVLDHATGRPLASARVVGHSADRVQYVYEEGSDPADALSRFAYSTLWSSIRQAIAAAFAAGGHRVSVAGT